jgi:hypothetical protein
MLSFRKRLPLVLLRLLLSPLLRGDPCVIFIPPPCRIVSNSRSWMMAPEIKVLFNKY